MDVIIRGMEMPKYTTKAEFGIDADGNPLCMVYHDDGTEPDIYDVIPLPEGHGRLIDGDAIVAELEKQVTERDKIMELCKRVGDMGNYFRCSNNQTEIVSFVRMLNNAPTIVSAEGGNDDGST